MEALQRLERTRLAMVPLLLQAAGFCRRATSGPPRGQGRGYDPGRREQAQAPTSARCGNCGRSAHADNRDCPAKDRECNTCGRLNHFASVCRAGSGQPSRGQPSRGHSSRGQAPRQPFSGGNGNGRGQHGSIRQIAARNPESAGRWNSANEFVVDPNGYAEYLRFKSANDYGCYRVADPLLSDGIRARVTI